MKLALDRDPVQTPRKQLQSHNSRVCFEPICFFRSICWRHSDTLRSCDVILLQCCDVLTSSNRASRGKSKRRFSSRHQRGDSKRQNGNTTRMDDDELQVTSLVTSQISTTPADTAGARRRHDALMWQRFARLCDRMLFIFYLLIFFVFFTTNIVTLWMNRKYDSASKRWSSL